MGAGGAAHVIQRVLEEHKAELDEEDSTWQRDPQEDELRIAEAEAEQEQAQWTETTRWNTMPVWVQVCLVLGWLFTTAMLYCDLQPVSRPFKKFGLTDELPKGGIADLISDTGYAALALLCCACVCMAAFQLWCL